MTTFPGKPGAGIAFKPSVFTPGQRYKLTVLVNRTGTLQTGNATYVFDVNLPPYGGHCSVHPNSGEKVFFN